MPYSRIKPSVRRVTVFTMSVIPLGDLLSGKPSLVRFCLALLRSIFIGFLSIRLFFPPDLTRNGQYAYYCRKYHRSLAQGIERPVIQVYRRNDVRSSGLAQA